MSSEQRIELAEAFLQEAVFASRAKQAAGASLMQGAGCGLGTRAEVVLDLSPRAAQLAKQLWPRELAADELEIIRRTTADWIERQDALDRKRNHFLKAFRTQHGFDRNAYSAEQTAAYDHGLEQVNADSAQARRSAAERLPR